MDWSPVPAGATLQQALSVLGVILLTIVAIAWVLSNRAEEEPNAEQRDDIRAFVENDFARYVARGLLSTEMANDGGAIPSLANDKGWQKVFVEHIRLHTELNPWRKQTALKIYAEYIDDAVRREVEALRAASAPAGNGALADGELPANRGANAATRFSG